MEHVGPVFYRNSAPFTFSHILLALDKLLLETWMAVICCHCSHRSPRKCCLTVPCKHSQRALYQEVFRDSAALSQHIPTSILQDCHLSSYKRGSRATGYPCSEPQASKEYRFQAMSSLASIQILQHSSWGCWYYGIRDGEQREAIPAWSGVNS